MKNILKNFNIYNFFVIVIIFIILYLWFKNTLLLATAEEGIPFYDSARTSSLYKSLWLEVGFGFSAPFYIPRLVLYDYAAFLQQIGLQSWFIQASVFFVLIFTPLFALPKLVQTLFPEKEKLYGYIAALFYLFNLYTLSQVFERFIYPLMFLWAYLPLFLLFWISWIEKKKIKHLFFLVISSILFADVFGLTSSFIVLATVALCYVFYKIIFEKERMQTLMYGVGGFFVWGFFQLWWIVPIWMLKNDTFEGFLNSRNSLASLKEVSQYFPTSQIIFLKQIYFFGEKNFLHNFYTQPNVIALSIIIFLIVLLGIIVSFRQKKWWYMFILFFLGWFVCKGSNPPFGEIFYNFLFSNFSFAQLLRNPYEKFGVVWLLSYSIFFSFGLLWIAQRLKVFKLFFIATASFLFMGYLVWPLWNGEVFANKFKVHVPEYYKKANQYLNSKDSHRLLQLPLLQEASIEYIWGYRGEEPSEFLFDRSSLSRSDLGQPTDAFYLHFPEYFTNKNFSNILQVSNISGVVVHKDTIQNKFNQQTIEDYEREIATWKNISKIKSFGMLDIYTLPKVNDWVYSISKIETVDTLKQGMDMMVADSFNPQSTGVVIKEQNKIFPSFFTDMVSPQVSLNKKSSTDYTVRIKNAKKPFVLIHSVSYNAMWHAKVDKQELNNHFKINGFANAWLINRNGDYIVDITFR